MKRLYLISIVILLSLLLFSCQTEKDYSSLSVAENKKGLEAAEVYEEFLSKNEDEKVRWNYVYSLYEAEEYDGALEEIDKGIALYPDNIRFLYIKSLVYRNTLSLDKEKETLICIESLNPGNIEVRKRLVEVYDALGEKEEAIREAKSILFYDSKNLVALEYLSRDSQFYSLLYSSLKPEEEENVASEEEASIPNEEENLEPREEDTGTENGEGKPVEY